MLDMSERIRRQFRDINYLGAAKRGFDSKPIQCSLYVTDRCNLDCSYCTEYDNSEKNPPLEVIKERLRHIRALGTLRVALVGGEPLMHPDIVEITRYAREIGFSTSLTTNGFLLTKKLIGELEEAGLQVMQISVDRVTPSDVTKKSLKSVTGKIEMMQNSRIKLHITGTVCEDTIEESLQVLEYGLSRNIPTEVRLVHAGPDDVMRVPPATKERQRALIKEMMALKRAGKKVHTSDAILKYQLDLIDGKADGKNWTCTAGYKIFFVSAKGKFMECSMRPTNRNILDITLEDMKEYHRQKSCQVGCGVYCAVSTSLFAEKPFNFVGKEIGPRIKQLFGETRAEPVS
jgi:MoaA/NifB/PqqE/SkfB family radical SAM enzyme